MVRTKIRVSKPSSKSTYIGDRDPLHVPGFISNSFHLRHVKFICTHARFGGRKIQTTRQIMQTLINVRGIGIAYYGTQCYRSDRGQLQVGNIKYVSEAAFRGRRTK